MKKNYEIYLMQHVTGSVEDDYETVDYITEYDRYYDYVRIAKELSKHYGEAEIKGYGKFPKREMDKDGFYSHGLDEGLAMVKIVCYTETEYSTYEPLFYEYYKDGKKDYRITFEPMVL